MQDTNEILRAVIDPGRRTFFKQLGKLGLGATAGGLLLNLPKLQGQTTTALDTANHIFTAALVAEDLATTFYYNELVRGVITDPALAGTGGTALNPSPSGDAGNVSYRGAGNTARRPVASSRQSRRGCDNRSIPDLLLSSRNL